MSRRRLGAAAAAAALAWALFESQWVERAELEVRLARLPPELDGLRLLHLSDLHLGSFSLNERALERALSWAQSRKPDLVAVTGDLLSRTRGRAALTEALARLCPPFGTYAVLGNHDVAETRDPFSKATLATGVAREGVHLLGNTSRSLVVRGVPVQIAGVDPLAYLSGTADPVGLVDPSARLRILLCHFPEVVDRLRPEAYDLVLAGHVHGGQVCLPYPGGKVRLSHVRGRYWEGLFPLRNATLHVSRGLGTTFVPFRLFARPEATELLLRPSG